MEIFEYEDEPRGLPIGKIIGVVVALLAGFLFLRLQSPNDVPAGVSSDAAADRTTTSEPEPTATTEAATGTTRRTTTTNRTPSSTQAQTDSSAPTPTDAAPSTDAAPTTDAAPATDAAPSTDAAPATNATTSSVAPTPPSTSITYPVLADGTPAPVVGVFGSDSITLSGVVPSQAARTRLEDLARALNQFPNASLVSVLTVDATVPPSVGFRMVQLESTAFENDSSVIAPAHAAELDRIVGLMNLFAHISVDVITHADQTGDANANFRVTEARALSVTSYFASQGIAPGRTAARAVGEGDLLTLDDDTAALALNRRTEFIFYGLLFDPPA